RRPVELQPSVARSRGAQRHGALRLARAGRRRRGAEARPARRPGDRGALPTAWRTARLAGDRVALALAAHWRGEELRLGRGRWRVPFLKHFRLIMSAKVLGSKDFIDYYKTMRLHLHP